MSVDMTTQSIAVADNWVKVGNDYVGDKPNGATSGGTAALAWSAPNGLSDGNTLTISTDGTNDFGAKSQAAPVLWDFGTEVYENGTSSSHRSSVTDGYSVESTSTNSDELYDNASDVYIATTSRAQRHARSTGHYVPESASINPFVDSPSAEGATVSEHDYHYLSLRIKYHYHFQKIHVIDYTGKSGTFSAPNLSANPEALGESLTLDNSEEAYLLLDTGSSLCFYTPNTTTRQTALAGTTITGASSGASCLVTDKGASTDDHSGPEKILRVWSEDDGSSGMRYTLNRTTSAFTGGTTVQDVYGDINNIATVGGWALVELFIDLSGNRGVVAVDGSIVSDLDITSYNGYTGVWDKTKGMRQRAIGWQGVRSLYNLVEFGEIYVDHTPQRLYIGNASTWGACTKLEIQRPTAWSSTSASFELNQGDLSSLSGGYAFLISDGYPEDSTQGLAL